ncbi:homeodomain-interacting protein kinase 2-like [Thunnus thynnus]|uniref:homeodomain-interacting protein kinase 2-like n=1 Tax=Thunnus thynnus TaxID=8237 RepID=UPI003527DCB9
MDFWGTDVFENLDITLEGFLSEIKTAMRLQDVRTIIQQMAVAFDALKSIGVIHTDVRTNNILLVDRVRPFRVKPIGFDMAIPSHKAKKSTVDHGSFYRAPEIMLGLPFSEAIDMWSLGCVMAEMVVGLTLFPGRSDHETLRYIIDILGPRPDHIIKEGRKSREYFQSDSQQWRLTEFSVWCKTDDRSYSFRSLDEIIKMCLKKVRRSRECINLLKAMFPWDGRKRITPNKVLTHPFITRSYRNKYGHVTKKALANLSISSWLHFQN